MYSIYGTYEDSVGQLIAGYFSRAVDRKVIPPYSAIGWVENKDSPIIVGQAVFVDYTGSNIEVHLNIPGKFSRRVIRNVYGYAFKQLKCNRLTAKVALHNQNLLQLLPRLGFEYECLMQAYYGEPEAPVDALVYKLTKNNALKWLQ